MLSLRQIIDANEGIVDLRGVNRRIQCAMDQIGNRVTGKHAQWRDGQYRSIGHGIEHIIAGTTGIDDKRAQFEICSGEEGIVVKVRHLINTDRCRSLSQEIAAAGIEGRHRCVIEHHLSIGFDTAQQGKSDECGGDRHFRNAA